MKYSGFNTKPKTILLLLAVFMIFENANSRTFDFKSVWFSRPYKGPVVAIELVGADICPGVNRHFDRWSKPDCYITCSHGRCKRKTQIEGNTYSPRFLWQGKFPYKSNLGFHFQVFEANVIKGSSVVGRAFLTAAQANEAIKSEKPVLLSIGDNIGEIKVQLSRPAVNYTKLDTEIQEMGVKLSSEQTL